MSQTDPRAVAKELSKKLRDAVMRAPIDSDAAEAMEIPLLHALADAERSVWMEAVRMTREMADLNRHAGRYDKAARDAVKEDREQQAQELGRCKSEKNDAVIELYRKLDAKDAELAASQARCRELEREIESLTTCGCEGCDDNLEESAFCLPCMNKVQQQVTQLQATLAAREARVRELEDQMNAKRYFTNEAL